MPGLQPPGAFRCRDPYSGARSRPAPRPLPPSLRRGVPGERPPLARPELLCATRARCVKAGAPRPHAHTRRRTISPWERQKGRRERRGKGKGEGAASEPNRWLPPRPRGTAFAIAASRAGTRRLGAHRSPDLREPGAVGASGRGAGAGPCPPEQAPRPLVFPGGRDGGPGRSGASTRDGCRPSGQGQRPLARPRGLPALLSSGTRACADTASPTPGLDRRVRTTPPRD